MKYPSKFHGFLASFLALMLVSSVNHLVLADKGKNKDREKSLRQETSDQFLKKWLDQDVVYIITDEEKASFKRLTTDDERYQFIESFWLRRDPSPDTIENETRDEHYRRIAYSNERFASGKPGWKTDRGRIYITWGPPDQIESHPSGGSYLRPQEEGANDDRVELLRELGIRSLESKFLGLMGVEPHPALPGGVVIQTAKLLERPYQPRAVQDLVMKPDRLEVLARHRCQEGLIRHFPCLTKSWTWGSDSSAP